MSRPKKIIIGVRPEKRWFRLMDHVGEIIDSTMRAVESSEFPVDFFSQIRRGPNNSSLSLRDEKGSRTLTISEDNFVFASSSYGMDAARLDFDVCYRQLDVLWNVFAKIMDCGGIRRIGILAEFRFESEDAASSKDLLKALTTFDRQNAIGRFMIQFQEMSRFPDDRRTGPINEESEQFINVIEQYYDGLLDTENAKSHCWNATIDYQHYFNPSIRKKVLEEVFRMRKPFLALIAKIKSELELRQLTEKQNRGGRFDEPSAAARRSE